MRWIKQAANPLDVSIFIEKALPEEKKKRITFVSVLTYIKQIEKKKFHKDLIPFLHCLLLILFLFLW